MYKMPKRHDPRFVRKSRPLRGSKFSRSRDAVLAKRAYAPSNKRRVKRITNPLAENKQVTGGEISSTFGLNSNGKPILTDYSSPPRSWPSAELTGAGGHIMNTQIWHFNPDSALYQTHGFDENQMIGRSVYQTLCAAKFLIKWPQPSMNTGINKYAETGASDDKNLSGVIPDQPMSYKLYWGWIPKKLLFTGKTDPKVTEASAYEIETEINQRVQDYFDQRKDRIQFIPKTTATINIIGSKKLHPRWDRHTGRMPVSTQVVYDGDSVDADDLVKVTQKGSIPDTLVKIKWPINRKIHFEPTTRFGDNTGETPDATGISTTPTGFYRNYDHLPFACIVNWNFEKLPTSSAQTSDNEGYERERRCPQILVNDITYYRDS